VLSDKDLRGAYDKYGKDSARPSEGFVDPAEFFSSIFGGDAFVDWIGEISLMKDLTATMDITMTGEDEEAAAAAAAAAGDEEFPGTEDAMRESAKEGAPADVKIPTVHVEDEKSAPPPYTAPSEKPAPTTAEAVPEKSQVPPRAKSPHSSGTSTPSRHAIPIRPALMDRPSGDTDMAGLTEEEKELRKKEKKKAGLTKEQREQLAAYERERAKIREERVTNLSQKLLDRVSVWTETDKGPDVTKAFQEKIRIEVENLKIESFGLDILHAISQVYLSKATALLKSQKFLGIGGFISRMRDKGTIVKETWNTISSAIEAQQTMEEMARMEQAGGDDWTEEKKVEYERRVTGKILTAAWRGSKYEIQSVLREVCDSILEDKKVNLNKRLERAKALVLIAEICAKVHTLCSEETSQVTDANTGNRQHGRPRRRASTWLSSSSSPKLQSRRRRNQRRREKIRIRSIHMVPHPLQPSRLRLPTFPRRKLKHHIV
jgi:hypothetical protein